MREIRNKKRKKRRKRVKFLFKIKEKRRPDHLQPHLRKIGIPKNERQLFLSLRGKELVPNTGRKPKEKLLLWEKKISFLG